MIVHTVLRIPAPERPPATEPRHGGVDGVDGEPLLPAGRSYGGDRLAARRVRRPAAERQPGQALLRSRPGAPFVGGIGDADVLQVLCGVLR